MPHSLVAGFATRAALFLPEAEAASRIAVRRLSGDDGRAPTS